MNEITDVEKNSELVRIKINELGFMPEHKYEYFTYLTDEGKPALIYDENSAMLSYIGTEGKSKIVKSLVEPMSKESINSFKKSAEIIEKYTKYILETKKFDKFILETRFETKKTLIERLKNTNFKVTKERYYLIWPIYILKNFDETLAGGKWKKMRKFNQKFFKENNPVVRDFEEKDKKGLKELVIGWVKKRTAGDRAYYHRYLNFIDSNFKGFDMVKVILVQDKPVAVFGGWKIPNTNNYYSCIGIYDYGYENMGEVTSILDLIFTKQLGFEKTDWSGGEEALTNFKKKFHPDEFYRTDIFAVVKKK